jgi:hypothetical protein
LPDELKRDERPIVQSVNKEDDRIEKSCSESPENIYIIITIWSAEILFLSESQTEKAAAI